MTDARGIFLVDGGPASLRAPTPPAGGSRADPRPSLAPLEAPARPRASIAKTGTQTFTVVLLPSPPPILPSFL